MTAKMFETEDAIEMYDINTGLNFSFNDWYENITESTDGVSSTKNMNKVGFRMNPCFR